MPLGTFVPPVSQSAASYDPRNYHGRPLIVVVREFRPDFTTRKFPQPKDVVIVDVVDLMEAMGMGGGPGGGGVYISVIWGGGAVVDRLKGQAPTDGSEPQRLPVKLVQVAPAGGGNVYYSVEPLEGKELDLAVIWDQKNPTVIDEKRAEKVAADQAAGRNGNGTGNGGGATVTPITGLGGQQSAPAATPAATPQPETPAASAPATGMDDAALQAAIDSLS